MIERISKELGVEVFVHEDLNIYYGGVMIVSDSLEAIGDPRREV